ncbi:uncharacterized protein DNG_09661 [Cephalotrichum gorgonifer]|uniref:Transcription factor domain-containing protein n=1 Tax=Cephalotrichum gorgonifer TaxID=2041049 RepID=A0AAE8N697_9PEZI|nr:uncharacterized protein DNG_09661 [Cephalotrichum gorgonifer]
MTGDTVEERQRKTYLFWSIYSLERGVSLRLARPSTIRDHDITISKPDPQPSTSAAIRRSLLDSVNAARIYGLVYDEIYSPRALAQPAGTLATRVHTLAAEWQEISTSKAEHLMKLARRFEGLSGSPMIEFTRHANKASDYAVLTAIYRATPGRTPASISAECTSAARVALQGHTECIILLLNSELHSAQLELLKALVQAMELLSEKPGYESCAEQLRIFRALYNVAVRYVEVKGKAYFAARSHNAGPDVGEGFNIIAATGLTAASSQMQSSGGYMGSGSAMDNFVRGGLGDGLQLQPVPHVLESQTWAGIGGMELDPLAQDNIAPQEAAGHCCTLRDAHRVFRARHKEQLRLIRDAAFVASLTRSLARMSQLASLWIDDGRLHSRRAALGHLERFQLVDDGPRPRHAERLVPGGRTGPPTDLYLASTILAAVTSESITDLFLENALVSWSDLGSICDKLDKEPIRVGLRRLRLLNDEWGPVARLL